MVRNQVQGCKKLSRWSIKSKWSEMTLEMSNRIFCDRNYSLNQFQKSLLSWKCPLQLITPSISITFWWCKNVWCCLPVMLPSAWREDFARRRRARMVRGGRKRVTRGDMVREDMSCCYWLPLQCKHFLNHTLSRVEALPVGKVLSTTLIEENETIHCCAKSNFHWNTFAKNRNLERK